MYSIASPILLLGVEAPAVIPIVTGPSGSQSVSTAWALGIEFRFVTYRPSRWIDPARVGDMIGLRVAPAEVGEVVRIRGVVTTDHDHDIRWILHHLEYGVLSLLGRRADRKSVV